MTYSVHVHILYLVWPKRASCELSQRCNKKIRHGCAPDLLSLPVLLMIQLSPIVYRSSLHPYCYYTEELLPVTLPSISTASFFALVWIFLVNRKHNTGTTLTRLGNIKQWLSYNFGSETAKEHKQCIIWPPDDSSDLIGGKLSPLCCVLCTDVQQMLVVYCCSVAVSSIAQSVKSFVFGNSFLCW